LFGAVLGRVVGRVGVPAGPDDSEPGAPEDPDGLGVALAAGAGVGIQLGCPWGAVAGVVGEDVQGLSGSVISGQAEVDAAGLARRPGDRGGAGLGGGVLGAAGTVQDRAQFGEQLGVAELADAGQSGQQADLGMLAQPVADGLVEVGNGGQQGGQQLGLGADDLASTAGSSPTGGCGADRSRCRSSAGWRPPR
jgi:hypothetical protein